MGFAQIHPKRIQTSVKVMDLNILKWNRKKEKDFNGPGIKSGSDRPRDEGERVGGKIKRTLAKSAGGPWPAMHARQRAETKTFTGRRSRIGRTLLIVITR